MFPLVLNCLTYQLQDFGGPNTTFVCNHTRENCNTDSTSVQCSEFPVLSAGIDHNTAFDLTDLDVLKLPDLSALIC